MTNEKSFFSQKVGLWAYLRIGGAAIQKRKELLDVCDGSALYRHGRTKASLCAYCLESRMFPGSPRDIFKQLPCSNGQRQVCGIEASLPKLTSFLSTLEDIRIYFVELL